MILQVIKYVICISYIYYLLYILWCFHISLPLLPYHSASNTSVVLITFNERVTFWLQRVQSLPCAFVFAVVHACAIAQLLYASLACTRPWPEPKSYSLIEGTWDYSFTVAALSDTLTLNASKSSIALELNSSVCMGSTVIGKVAGWLTYWHDAARWLITWAELIIIKMAS